MQGMGRKTNGAGKLRFPRSVETKVLWRSEQVQVRVGCGAKEEHTVQTAFEAEVTKICEKYDCEAGCRDILSYFRDNWWCKEWRGMFSVVPSFQISSPHKPN